MGKQVIGFIVVLALVPVGGDGAFGETPAQRLGRLAGAVRATQVTIVLDRAEGRFARFRGTVLRRDGDALTILTAGHCFAPDDLGREVLLSREQGELSGRVERVARNPSYDPGPDKDSPGADNEVVVVRVRPPDADSPFFEGLATATIARSAVPDGSEQTVAALTIDQRDQVRVLRATNLANPLWLEWGAAYRPIPGDSGSGLFAFERGKDGAPRPILIGVVVVRSNLGGGASVVHRGQPWFRQATGAERAPSP